MNEQVYTAAFPFGGCGGGALGFLNASVSMLGTRASFRLTGGVEPGFVRYAHHHQELHA